MSIEKEKQKYLEDELGLNDLFGKLWREKWVLFATTILFTLGGVVYAIMKPNVYEARILLAPAQQDGGGLKDLASQFGGIASLAGINLNASRSNKDIIALEVLQSRKFIANFIQEREITVPVFAVDGWDEGSSSWTYDRDKYDPLTKTWHLPDNREQNKPTDWELVKEFKEKNLNVSKQDENGLISVAIRNYSAEYAKKWAEWLIEDLNNFMRKQDISESQSRIDYLQDMLDQTNVSDMKKIFYTLIENETRTVMLANSQKEYVFKIIDPPMKPEEEVEPLRVVIVIIGFLGGVFAGLFLIGVRHLIAIIKVGKDN